MTISSISTTGGCLCGAVRYEAVGEPITVGYCHCPSCRRHTGAPVAAVVKYELDQIKFTKGDRKIYNSSPGVGRGFCDQCGSSLTWEGKYKGRVVFSIQISTLDKPDDCVPVLHWFHELGISWFETVDNLPR
jgi:hypothetical protein